MVKNSNGGTRIDVVAGDLRLSAGNGDLSVGRADGNVTASAAYGEIRIGQVSRSTTAIKTGLGEIEVGVAPGAPARLDLFTSFGRLRNTLTPTNAPAPTAALTPTNAPAPTAALTPTNAPTPAAPLASSARTSHGDITIRPA